MTPFILKSNYVKKAYIQILKFPMTSFIVKIKNGYLQTPNISITPTHTKKITLKRIFTNLKITGTTFCLSPFSNIQKAYLQISKYLTQFFCSSPFSNIKKRILTNLKIPGTVFRLSPFSNIKKTYL